MPLTGGMNGDQADYRGSDMTYDQAIGTLPPDAKWSCSFGNPGEDGYSEFWRDRDGQRFEVKKTADRPATYSVLPA
jgi:hypothetical protein